MAAAVSVEASGLKRKCDWLQGPVDAADDHAPFDEHDPLAADFNNKSFNSFVHGPGRSYSDMASAKKRSENVRLLFFNLPGFLDKNGLANICATVQPEVVHCNVFKHGNNSFSDGFVEYRTIREAQEVFFSLHEKPPLNLKILFKSCLETTVNRQSFKIHNEILFNQRRQRRMAEMEVKEFPEICFPVNDMSAEAKIDMIEFAEENIFNWKFCTGRGVVLPPRQPFVSNALNATRENIEHYNALLSLDLDGNREHELDCFWHFSVSFSDDTTAVMEMVYNMRRNNDCRKVNNICGGRCFSVNRPVEEQVGIFADPDTFTLQPLMHCSQVLKEKVAISLDFEIDIEGQLFWCSVCSGVTATCCSTCTLPLCSAICFKKHCENQICQNLRDRAKIHPNFQSKLVTFENYNDCNDLIKIMNKNLSISDGYHIEAAAHSEEYVPASILEKSFSCSELSTVLIKDVVTQFGEPVAFVCSVLDKERKEMKDVVDKLHSLHTKKGYDAAAVLIEVEPNLEVGGLALAYLNDKQCRVLLDRKVPGKGWRCIFVDKGYLQIVPDEKLFALPVNYSSLPRLATVCVVSKYFVPFKELWTKYLQPNKKLYLKDAQNFKQGGMHQMRGKLLGRSKVVLGEVTITDWLPRSPQISKVIPHVMLKSKDAVCISAFCSSNMCYVQLNSRSADLCKLQSEISVVKLNCIPLAALPPAGSVVAVKSAIDGKMYRAMVKNQTSECTVIVFCLDFGNREEVHLNQIYPLPKHLCEMPAEAVLLRLKDVPVRPLTYPAYSIWAQLQENNVPLEVQLEAITNSAVLISLETNESVNSKLTNALACSSKSRDESQTDEQILPSPMHLQEGKLQKLVVLRHGDGSFTCTVANTPLLRHILDTLVREAAKYVANCERGNYVPCPQEVCLAKANDGLFYRAIAMNFYDDSCDVLFIDFGDVLKVPHTELRKIPPHFLNIPALATVATIFGLEQEDYSNPKLRLTIQEYLPIGVEFEALVCKQREDKEVEVFVPKLLDHLNENSLLPADRLSSVMGELEQYRAEIPESLDAECAILIDV
ncbi:tudor domain-containing protein 1 [Cloeon dipterum]|uniref:tudor domain-containing protein 1 n=1 Tax=Cloeon dipterum TaxID=197152 RepID=UPI0032207878